MSNSILKLANGGRVVSAYVQETIVPGQDDSIYPYPVTGIVLFELDGEWVTAEVVKCPSGTYALTSASSRHFNPAVNGGGRFAATMDYQRRIAGLTRDMAV